MGLQPFISVGSDINTQQIQEQLAAKQDLLTTEQLNAVNSGITSTGVTNLNTMYSWYHNNVVDWVDITLDPSAWRYNSVDRVEIGKEGQYNKSVGIAGVIIDKKYLRAGNIKTIKLFQRKDNNIGNVQGPFYLKVCKQVDTDTFEYVAASSNGTWRKVGHDLFFNFDNLTTTGEENIALCLIADQNNNNNEYYNSGLTMSNWVTTEHDGSETCVISSNGSKMMWLPRVNIEYEREPNEDDSVYYHFTAADVVFKNNCSMGLPCPTTRENAELVGKLGILLTEVWYDGLRIDALQMPTDMIDLRLEFTNFYSYSKAHLSTFG